jgi:hypothetical protein
MGEQPESYRVIITPTGKKLYYELLLRLYDLHSYERVGEISEGLLELADSLKTFPEKGAIEEMLSRENQYRYLVYQRTTRATIKLIYYVDQFDKMVYITDFFATEMSPDKIAKRK